MAEKAKWVPIIAVIGIVISSFGILGGIQYLSMPQIMKMQKEYLPEMMKYMDKAVEKTGWKELRGPPEKPGIFPLNTEK